MRALSEPDRARPPASFGAGARSASIGVAGAGLIAYAYFALASHSLSAADYGGITLLWSAVFITVAIVYRPVEQLLSRSLAERDAHGGDARRTLAVAALIEFVLGGGAVALALIFRGPLEDQLLGGSSVLYWVLVATIAAYAGSYFARGALAGRRRLGAYGALVASESGIRVLFALAVAVGIASGQPVVALGLVAAPVASSVLVIAVVAVAARSRRRAGGHAGERSPEGTALPGATVASAVPAAPGLGLAHGGAYAGGALAIMLAEQTFLNAGPLIVNGSAGAALSGIVFNVLLIARAPIQLFQAVQASILPHLAGLRARGESAPFQRSVTVTIRLSAAFALVAALVLAAVGPQLMGLLFGTGAAYERAGLVLVALGMGAYLAASTLTQALLARGQARRAALPWLGASAAFVALLLTPTVADRLLRVELAFFLAALALALGVYLLYRRGGATRRRRHRRPGEGARPTF